MHYEEQEITQAYLDMAETDAGEIILEDLRESFYDIHPFNPDQTDPNMTIFMEGCRWVVGYILDQSSPKDPEQKRDNHNKGLYL